MSVLPQWAEEYVGIPFAEKGRTRAGCDCWGLYRLVAAERFGVRGLPDYGQTYTSAHDRLSVADAIEDGLLRGWQRVPEPVPGALVVLRLMGKPWHVAVAVDETWFLHTLDGMESACERFDTITWRNRLEGIYVRA